MKVTEKRRFSFMGFQASREAYAGHHSGNIGESMDIFVIIERALG